VAIFTQVDVVDDSQSFTFDYDVNMKDKGQVAINVDEDSDPTIVYFSISEEDSGNIGPFIIAKMWNLD
jgi:hypothetical protein